MADRLELLKEANRRGILPPEMKALLEEAERRGLDRDPSTAEDVARALPRGVVRGGISVAGAGGDIREGLTAATGFIARQFGLDEQQAEKIARGVLRSSGLLLRGPTSEQIEAGVESEFGEFQEPRTRAGQFTQTIGEFTPGAFAPGSPFIRLLQVVMPAVVSETAGQLTEGTPLEAPARIGGALVGGGGVAGVRRAVTPGRVRDPQVLEDVATLEREGVRSITAGQRLGDPRLKKQESLSEFSAAARTAERGKEEFTREALRRAGIDAERATPEVIDAAFDTIGSTFDQLQARNSIVITPRLRAQVKRLVDEFQDQLPEQATPRIVRNLPDRIANKRRLSGTEYKELRQAISNVSRGTKDSLVSRPLNAIIRELDDAAELTMAVENPSDLGGFREARRQFRNLLVIEKASLAAGEEAARGLISPARLRQAAVNIEGGRQFLRGRGEFTELARSGVSVLSPPRSSGTPEGLRALGATGGLLGVPSALFRAGRTSALGQRLGASQLLPQETLGGLGGPSRAILAAILARNEGR